MPELTACCTSLPVARRHFLSSFYARIFLADSPFSQAMLLLLLATSAFLQLTEGVDITQEWTKYYSATGALVRLRSMVPDLDENYFVCGTLCLKT